MRCARACACKHVAGEEVTVVCIAQHFAVLLLACYPSIMNEVLRIMTARAAFFGLFRR